MPRRQPESEVDTPLVAPLGHAWESGEGGVLLAAPLGHPRGVMDAGLWQVRKSALWRVTRWALQQM